MNENAPHRLLTVNAVAAKLSRSVSSIWSDAAVGRLPRPIKIGSSARWDEAELDAFIDDRLAKRERTDTGRAA
jgi:predicted DNA-binding transcriptional regulator AlpA